MTTLVALATKDALVMGCDSLGTVTKQLVDPMHLLSDFFDPKKNLKLKVDKDGDPLLKEFKDIYAKTQSIPFNHMTHVTKIFDLAPLEMGIMTTGILSIGERNIKGLINEFKKLYEKSRPTNYTVKSVGKKLLEFINQFYLQEYPEEWQRPVLEFMIGGYDKQKHTPTIYRILVHRNELVPSLKESIFGISFGGQMREIQRLVFGTDDRDRLNLIGRHKELLNKYHDILQGFLKKKGNSIQLPIPDTFGDDLNLFHNWELEGFISEWAEFSEQNAIDCVDFFVNIMVSSQQFCSTMPTVGGDVRLALITKEEGFRFISREEYEHEGYKTPIKGGKR